MALGTFSFDAWLMALKTADSPQAVEARLDHVAALSRKLLDVRMRFTRISGPRWAYLAGEREDLSPSAFPAREELTDGVGLLSNLHERLAPDECEQVLGVLRKLANGEPI